MGDFELKLELKGMLALRYDRSKDRIGIGPLTRENKGHCEERKDDGGGGSSFNPPPQ